MLQGQLLDIEIRKKPVVAITMRITGALHYRETRDSVSHDLLTLVQSWGLHPVLIPNQMTDVQGFVSTVGPDLILFSGGDDLDSSSIRDKTELALLKYTVSHGLPMFGICRGLQLFNQYFGGHNLPTEGHVATQHNVKFTPKFRQYFGSEITVNSYHNYAVDESSLADELIPVAQDDHGQIEALAHRVHPLLAVMWHPERLPPGLELNTMIDRLIREKTFWR